jgi:hypothetical protein
MSSGCANSRALKKAWARIFAEPSISSISCCCDIIRNCFS